MDAYSATVYPFLGALPADHLTTHAGFVTRDAHNAVPCACNGARGACSVIVSADNVARGADTEAVGSSPRGAARGQRRSIAVPLDALRAQGLLHPGLRLSRDGAHRRTPVLQGSGCAASGDRSTRQRGKATPLPSPRAVNRWQAERESLVRAVPLETLAHRGAGQATILIVVCPGAFDELQESRGRCSGRPFPDPYSRRGCRAFREVDDEARARALAGGSARRFEKAHRSTGASASGSRTPPSGSATSTSTRTPSS